MDSAAARASDSTRAITTSRSTLNGSLRFPRVSPDSFAANCVGIGCPGPVPAIAAGNQRAGQPRHVGLLRREMLPYPFI